MPRTRVAVVQDPEEVVSKEVLAKAICDLSDGVNKLLLNGLNEKAVVVLLRDSTGCSKGTIKRVLQAMAQLRTDYTHD